MQVVAASITTAGGGVVTLLSDGNFTYSPAAKFAGTDSFDYTLLDSAGASAVGTVTLNVTNQCAVRSLRFRDGRFRQSGQWQCPVQ